MPVASYHTPVLLPQVLHFLFTRRDGVYLDATAGGGGHSEAIARHLDARGLLISVDVDPDSIKELRVRLKPFADRTALVKGNFAGLKQILGDRNIERVTGILFDLGVSSHQLDDESRGFSFRTDQKLDMRMDPEALLEAAAVVNTYEENQLAALIRTFGEERQAARIARAIVRQRDKSPMTTTKQLVAAVESAVGGGGTTKSLARVFQALRIEVNRELESLERALHDAIEILEPQGRIVVLSYHSLEDRIVKQQFRDASKSVRPGRTPLEEPTPIIPRLRLLTRKPVIPAGEEVNLNPRARSAKLRAAEKLNSREGS